jgi:hypothetical protein
MEWIEGHKTWDMKKAQFAMHVRYEDIKLVLRYHRLYEDMFVIDEVQTLDGQNIIDIVRDRTLQILEKMI